MFRQISEPTASAPGRTRLVLPALAGPPIGPPCPIACRKYRKKQSVRTKTRLWWLELEEAIRRLETVDTGTARLAARTPAEKSAAFDRIYWLLRARPEVELLETVGELARRAGVDGQALSDGLFMDWSEVVALSRHPLATIGAHSVTHRRLAHWSLAEARAEMADSKGALEARLGIGVRDFAYPVGDKASAGPARIRPCARTRFHDRGHDAPRHAVSGARPTPDRAAASFHQWLLAERRGAGSAAERRAVLAVERRPAGRGGVDGLRLIPTSGEANVMLIAHGARAPTGSHPP